MAHLALYRYGAMICVSLDEFDVFWQVLNSFRDLHELSHWFNYMCVLRIRKSAGVIDIDINLFDDLLTPYVNKFFNANLRLFAFIVITPWHIGNFHVNLFDLISIRTLEALKLTLFLFQRFLWALLPR